MKVYVSQVRGPHGPEVKVYRLRELVEAAREWMPNEIYAAEEDGQYTTDDGSRVLAVSEIIEPMPERYDGPCSKYIIRVTDEIYEVVEEEWVGGTTGRESSLEEARASVALSLEGEVERQRTGEL